jgi:hypothetical protein
LEQTPDQNKTANQNLIQKHGTNLSGSSDEMFEPSDDSDIARVAGNGYPVRSGFFDSNTRGLEALDSGFMFVYLASASHLDF